MAAGRPVTLYGIKNCDTVKKARHWLDEHRVAYAFHDYRTEGIDRARLNAWVAAAGWETVLNRSSATFRALPDAAKGGLTKAKAIALMLREPTMIKRPVLEADGEILVGFKPEAYETALA